MRTIQVETVTLADGSKMDVIRDIEAVRRALVENERVTVSEQYTDTLPTKPGAYWWKLSKKSGRCLVEVSNESTFLWCQMAGQTGGGEPSAFKGFWCGPLVPEQSPCVINSNIVFDNATLPNPR